MDSGSTIRLPDARARLHYPKAEEFEMETRRPRWTRTALVLFLPFLCLACSDVVAADQDPPPPHIIDERSELIQGGGGVGLTVYEAGNLNGPSIVFIHGFSQNHLAWERQFASSLAEEFHLVGFDLRGHGASEQPLEAEAYTDSRLWADDLAAVIQQKGLERPVVVGWSYGGYVIADYIRTYGAEGLGGLAFVGPVTKAGTPEAFAMLTDDVLAIFEDVLAPDLRTSLTATRSFSRLMADSPGDDFEVVYGSAMMVPPEVRLAMFSRELDNDDILGSLELPTIAIHGGADRVVGLTSSEHIVDLVPEAELIVYEGAGHTVFMEDPNRFNSDLGDFVRAVNPTP
jgi:non-heme chloroperoxidase